MAYEMKLPLIVAITGATGSIYGLSLIRKVLEQNVPVIITASDPAKKVIEQEAGHPWRIWVEEFSRMGSVEAPDHRDVSAAVSSGSFETRGMVIAPCSMGTLGRIAAGLSSTLIERAADVTLKERRPLILVARETPLSLIHLENMVSITKAGGVILPPMPAFYHEPKTIRDLVDHTVERILDHLAMPAGDASRWRG